MGGSRDTAMVKGSGILGGLRDTGGAPGYRGSGILGQSSGREASLQP